MANKCAVILAGGEGKRMKSDKPKTLSEVMGKPMLQWVIDALRKSGVDNICVVKGYKKDERFSDDHCTAYTRKNSRFIYFVSEQ